MRECGRQVCALTSEKKEEEEVGGGKEDAHSLRLPTARNVSKHDCKEGEGGVRRGRQSGSQKMTVWFVNRQLGFVWRG